MMQVIRGVPPNYPAILAVFPMASLPGVIFTAIEQSKDERVVQQLMAQFEHTKAVIEELEKREQVT